MIWKKPFTLDKLNKISEGCMVEHLGMRFTGFGDDFLEATMPVDHRTKQVAGLLHGGASVALAETLGSIAAWLCVEDPDMGCVGVEINANHLSSVRSGEVTAQARPLRIGHRLQVWDIRIHQQTKLVCICRLTTTAVKKSDS